MNKLRAQNRISKPPAATLAAPTVTSILSSKEECEVFLKSLKAQAKTEPQQYKASPRKEVKRSSSTEYKRTATSDSKVCGQRCWDSFHEDISRSFNTEYTNIFGRGKPTRHHLFDRHEKTKSEPKNPAVKRLSSMANIRRQNA
jgi:hypothetical protein